MLEGTRAPRGFSSYRLVVLGVVWGVTFPVGRLGVSAGANPFLLVVVDLLLAVALSALFAGAFRTRFPSLRGALESAGAGALLIGGINLPLFWGLQYATGSVASILYAASPLLSLVILLLLGSQRGNLRLETAALALGVAGVAAVALASGGAVVGNPIGLAAFGLGALCQGTGAVLLGRLRPSGENLWGQTFQFAGAAGASVVVLAVWAQPLALPMTAPVVGSILYVGAASMALGYILFFGLLRDDGAVRANQVTLVNPVVALLFGVLVVSEPFRLPEIAGLLLILLALVLLQLHHEQTMIRARQPIERSRGHSPRPHLIARP
ncbi:MAG: DMT family transporter [Thermoplasmata archaeon]|nr:DMT family transporter [Thermoplasmata archaeon]